jgi:hypothetical protein
MRKSWIERVLTIPAKHLCDHRDNREHHAHQTVLKNARPYHIKPSQPGARLPERSAVLPARTLLHKKHPPEPINRRQCAKELLLLVQARRHILAHEREEARDGKRFIAVTQHLVVDGVLVI